MLATTDQDLLRCITEKVLANSMGRQLKVYKWLKSNPNSTYKTLCAGDMLANNWPGIVMADWRPSTAVVTQRGKSPVADQQSYKPPFLTGRPQSGSRSSRPVKMTLVEPPPRRHSNSARTTPRLKNEPWQLAFKVKKNE
ncbi:hypothetical protein Ciccas_003034 [Cichlidogyrus casuarinus]|uniref:Uncharacterized protein n=1 Tax=Cichlidogyrus casuarinus TaxID=1844966 RepID=A0ABD2QGH8_9PLAT